MVEPIELVFPRLVEAKFHITSPATRAHNCIAWAAGDTMHWWWPDIDSDNNAIYWPTGVALEETIEAFAAAFATIGYAPCSGETPEPEFERITLFARHNVPTHAACQLHGGRWTSKLGLREDIEHDLHDLTGDLYGAVALLLKRPLKGAQSASLE